MLNNAFFIETKFTNQENMKSQKIWEPRDSEVADPDPWTTSVKGLPAKNKP